MPPLVKSASCASTQTTLFSEVGGDTRLQCKRGPAQSDTLTSNSARSSTSNNLLNQTPHHVSSSVFSSNPVTTSDPQNDDTTLTDFTSTLAPVLKNVQLYHERIENGSTSSAPSHCIENTHNDSEEIQSSDPELLAQRIQDNMNGEGVSEFYDLVAKDTKGNTIPFKILKGKLVLIVNIATQCMASYQLEQLEQLYQTYKDDGFIILAFPSNQFHQERNHTGEEIIQVCSRKYNVTFPIMEKVVVNGKNHHDVFRYLKSNKRGWLNSTRVKWNYEKFLIDRSGNVIKRYSTLQKPSKQIREELQTILSLEREVCDSQKPSQKILYI